ncbi:MAG TPA: succinylglutamate desuccinylase/aspartoacylase family protein, partial [Marmoricola sp.]|nr:succinylglutamate desuccinylase/aspartoacylase family protein [Marmoricola sp.]
MFTTAMPAAAYHDLLRAKVDARGDLVHASHLLRYRAGDWELMRIASAEIGPSDRVVVVRGTIHGDEVAGALTVLNHLDEIVDHAHERGLKVIIYPLGNPSGFERGIRYNADHHVGEGNNDFLRYVLADGSVRGDLPAGQRFDRWVLADEPELAIDLPPEARLMLSLVRQDPNDQVVAAFDLHQDLLTEELGPCAYHYAFGDVSRYDGIVVRL